MGLFDRIMEKLGIGHPDETQPQPGRPLGGTTTTAGGATADSGVTPPPAAPVTGSPTAAPISQVDVAAKLEAMAATHGEQLNWRTSIVDLLKLLGLYSSLEARKDLASELGCPPDQMADSAQMNTWLHREVMKRLAEHGGTIPPELM